MPFEEARKTFERDYLVRLLKITGGNVTQAAQLAKRNRTEFYKLLQRHRLEPAMFKEAEGVARASQRRAAAHAGPRCGLQPCPRRGFALSCRGDKLSPMKSDG